MGGIHQLRGQEEGEGGSAKSPRLSTQLDGTLIFLIFTYLTDRSH